MAYLLLLLLFSTACTRKVASNALVLKMPIHNASKNTPTKLLTTAAVPGAISTSWGLSDPTDVTQINCYAVFVGATDSNLSTGQCVDFQGTKVFSFGQLHGLVGPGQTVTFDSVPSGPNRQITVLGFASTASSCENAFEKGGVITYSKYSNPIVVGTAQVDLSSNDATVTIKEALTTTKIRACSNFSGYDETNNQLKAILMSSGDVVGPAFSPLASSSPVNESITHSGDESVGASGQPQSGVGSVLPVMVHSITQKPDTKIYFGLLHDGTVVQLDPNTGQYQTPASCPFKTCKVPAWFQSISAGLGTELYGLDHAGNLYRFSTTGQPEQTAFSFGPQVRQVAFY